VIDPGFWRGRRVLLTGHTGFKGAWLALWLADLGAEVTGFAGPPPSDPSLFELARVGELLADARGDMRDAEAVRRAVRAARPEIVFHLAAQALVRRSYADPVGTWETNVLGTAHLLDAIREAAADAAVVVVTSDKCYANDGSGRAFREDDPLGGSDPYSASKAAQELVAASYRDAYGLRIATARAGNVIGGGDWGEDRLVPDFFRAAELGEPLVVRNPGAVRPWQHVVNPLSGYVLLAERLVRTDDAATAWNFGGPTGDEPTVAWVVDRLRLARPGKAAITGMPDGPSEAPALRLDSARARTQLGWAPRCPLAQAIGAVVAWHREVAGGKDPRAVTLAQLREIAGPA
jgi:CDP-glucose 4,6-dehydratase